MRHLKLFTVVLALAIGTLGTTAAANGNNIPATGMRINLFPGFVGPTVYPANTPFFIKHGWGCGDQASLDARSGDGCLNPDTNFVVLVDGQQTHSITDLEVGPGGIVAGKTNLTNFRFGLSPGTHTFEGQWWFDGSLAMLSNVNVLFTG